MPITNEQCQNIMLCCILQQEASQGQEKLQDLQQENASNCSLFNRMENIPGRSPATNKSLYKPLEPFILHDHKSIKLATNQVVRETRKLQLWDCL